METKAATPNPLRPWKTPNSPPPNSSPSLAAAFPANLNTYTKMTKKTFIALADTIIASGPADRSAYGAFSDSAIKLLADFCAAQNPAFNRARWLAYVAGDCVPNGGKRKV